MSRNLAPYLMVPGMIAGVLMGRDMSIEVRELRQADALSTCEQVLETSSPDCVAAALACAQDIYRQDLRLGWRKTEQLEQTCLKEKASNGWQ